MGVPQTTGIERKSIGEMKKNDYIKVQATSLDNWLVGDAVIAMEELSTNGVAWATSGDPFSKHFYLIKVDKGLLVADRIWQHTVSWDTLNTNFLIEGRVIEIDGVQGQLRSPTGGISFADNSGNSTFTQVNKYAYPTGNEYDRYINEKEYFNYKNCYTSCKETPVLGTWIQNPGTTATSNSGMRVCRGCDARDINRYTAISTSSLTSNIIGYRPLFEYNENNL